MFDASGWLWMPKMPHSSWNLSNIVLLRLPEEPQPDRGSTVRPPGRRPSGGREDPRENRVHVPELLVEVERPLDLGGRGRRRHVGGGQAQRLEVASVVRRPA